MPAANDERKRGLRDEDLIRSWLQRDAERKGRRFRRSTPDEDRYSDIDAYYGNASFSIKSQSPRFENFLFELYTDYFDLRTRRKGWYETGKAEYYLYAAGPEQRLYRIKKSDVQEIVAREGWPEVKPTSREVQEREGKVTYNGLIPIQRLVSERKAVPIAVESSWRGNEIRQPVLNRRPAGIAVRRYVRRKR